VLLYLVPRKGPRGRLVSSRAHSPVQTDHLAEMDRQIRETETTIEQQRHLIVKLKARGRATTDAELALDCLVRALGVLKSRQQTILDAGQRLVDNRQ
jgi:hypothetical protein